MKGRKLLFKIYAYAGFRTHNLQIVRADLNIDLWIGNYYLKFMPTPGFELTTFRS